MRSNLGIEVNGLELNGLEVNGIEVNGIEVNGDKIDGDVLSALLTEALPDGSLSQNSVDAASFAAWFDVDPFLRGMLMKYLVICSLPEAAVLTHGDETWTGSIGLYPAWATRALDRHGQQVVSACLGVLDNRFGRHVLISVDGDGFPARTAAEAADFPLREGSFYGNLFDPSIGLWSCNGRQNPDGSVRTIDADATLRACAVAGPDGYTACKPILYAGNCVDVCNGRTCSTPDHSFTTPSVATSYIKPSYDGL
jgi:hypothetical protein